MLTQNDRVQSLFVDNLTAAAIPITVVSKNDFAAFHAALPLMERNWLDATGIKADCHKPILMPNSAGQLAKVIYILEKSESLWSWAGLSAHLPVGIYQLQDVNVEKYALAAVSWGLANYKFTRYKKPHAPHIAQLYLPPAVDSAAIQAEIAATFLVRDLINTTAEDMDPAGLATVAASLAESFGGQFKQVVGEELIAAGFPAIYAVGKGSARAPRLLDLQWGDVAHPHITLVGKGVTFDSGGLDLKSASNMRIMKKDMGGAAHVLGLALWIMRLHLPIRLRVIIGAAENMVSGTAYRPGDVVATRKGLSIEIGNTDAEGRVVLADCLALACEDNPAAIIDIATLTGAARVGLGPDIPNLYSNDPQLAQQLQVLSQTCDDMVWHMPLHHPYRDFLDSHIADISNESSSSYGGAIAAALFLNEFVSSTIPWLHLDTLAWNAKNRPGRPEGGEAMGLRAVFHLIKAIGATGKI